jgi:hypothetical protein
MRWVEQVANMAEVKNARSFLVGKSEYKRKLGMQAMPEGLL